MNACLPTCRGTCHRLGTHRQALEFVTPGHAGTYGEKSVRTGLFTCQWLGTHGGMYAVCAETSTDASAMRAMCQGGSSQYASAREGDVRSRRGDGTVSALLRGVSTGTEARVLLSPPRARVRLVPSRPVGTPVRSRGARP